MWSTDELVCGALVNEAVAFLLFSVMFMRHERMYAGQAADADDMDAWLSMHWSR